MAERVGFFSRHREIQITVGKIDHLQTYFQPFSNVLGFDFSSVIGKTNPEKMVSNGRQKIKGNHSPRVEGERLGYNGFMSKDEPILPEKERKILLAVYENPDKSYDTSLLNDILHFPDFLDLANVPKLVAARGTPEYMAAFKQTVKTIESLVEKGLIDGQQLKQEPLGDVL